jgi:hypothetical protein
MEEVSLYRVTEVISDYSDFSMVPPDVLNMASERGTAVHALCAAYAKGIYTPVPEPYGGYLNSFMSWFDSEVYRVIDLERRFTHKAFGFTGQPDLIVVLYNGEIVLIDLKTPVTKYKTWKAQLAAYLRLARAEYPGIKKAGSLRLNPDGKTATMDWLEPKEELVAFNAFLSKLNADRYFRS